jgi:alpha 1,6-mannosyltransferase
MAAPNHPILSFTVDRLVSRIEYLARTHRTTLDKLNLLFREVVDGTRPGTFTDGALEALSLLAGSTISYRNLTGLREPRQIGDILILPINAFGSGQKHSGSDPLGGPSALLRHNWISSWVPLHPHHNIP